MKKTRDSEESKMAEQDGDYTRIRSQDDQSNSIVSRRSLIQAAGIAGVGLTGLRGLTSLGQAQSSINFPEVIAGCAILFGGQFTNPNSEPITFSITGADADQFQIVSDNVIPANSSAELQITFSPTSVGNKQATLIATGPDGQRRNFIRNSETVEEVALTGTGTDLADATLEIRADFGDVPVGQSVTGTFTDVNNSPINEPIEILGSRIVGPDADEFSVQNLNVGQIIQPGEQYTYDVVFSPTSTGQKEANLQIQAQFTESGANDCAIGQIVGTGVEPQPPVDPIEEFFQLIDEAVLLLQEAIQLLISGGSLEEVQALLDQVEQLLEQAIGILTEIMSNNATQAQLASSTTEDDLTTAALNTEQAASIVDDSMSTLNSCDSEGSRGEVRDQLVNSVSKLEQIDSLLCSETGDE